MNIRLVHCFWSNFDTRDESDKCLNVGMFQEQDFFFQEF